MAFERVHKQGGEWLKREERRKAGLYHPYEPSSREAEREAVLADWVGEERRAEVFASFRPKPQKISTLVEALMKERNLGEMQLLETIRNAWESIVGKVNAPQCYARLIENKRLVIEVYHASWQYILTGQKPIFLKRAQDLCNGEIVAIDIVPQGMFKKQGT